MIVNGAGLPFRLLPPFLADRYGQLNVSLPLKRQHARHLLIYLSV